MQRRRFLGTGPAILGPLLAAPVAGAGRAMAQEGGGAWPGRPVQMVVAFPPGGQADVVARPMAAALERLWQQPVPVVNRAGASGEVGNASVARAAPDGHTLLMALNTLIVLPMAARMSGRNPAYQLPQFTPIALVTADPTILVVPASAPWRTVEEFLDDARQRPGQISYSSAGIYSALHLPMALLAQVAGVDLLHVPFQGGGPALTALLAGQVQALASGPGPATPHVREGRLRALASWGAQRIPGYESVPTLMERGFGGTEFYIWSALFGPVGLPSAVLAKLRASVAEAARDPELGRALAASGNRLDHRDGEAFLSFLRTDTTRLQGVVQKLGRLE